MTVARSALLLVVAALVGGGAMAIGYGLGDGLFLFVLLLAAGAPVLALAHLFARNRARVGSLSRQFAVGTGLAIGLALLTTGVVAGLLFVSAHDAFTLAVMLLFAAGLAAYSATLVASGVMKDIETVRDGVMAVGEGRRDLEIVTHGNCEIGELAQAANRMVEQLAKGDAQREMAESARRELMAAVSHDLRTPLASLRVLAEAIEGDVIDAETRARYTAQLGVHIHSLGALIDDLFELSKLEAGEIEWSVQQVELDELVQETVEAMRPQAGTRGVTVRASLPPALPAARANPEKVQRVLFNLIQNAIRHTPHDGTITVAAQPEGEVVVIEVADTGEGITPAERERIFEPFYRGGSQSSRTRSGAGLGLTICRAIVEAHGGEIRLGEAGQGTRIRFSLPSARGWTKQAGG